ncbi:MAG: type II secretion system protein GspG [Phycisphaerae bacterium]|nr:type II secretion system protein GspG [Phycisphaerae bacterium]
MIEMRTKPVIRRGMTRSAWIVAIAILTVVAVFAVPKMLRPRTTGAGWRYAKRDLTRPRMAIVEDAVGRFYMDCGRYPTDREYPGALLVNPGSLTGWNGPYIKRSQLQDPWGNEYRNLTESPASVGSFDLCSFGADGREGGKGADEDVFSSGPKNQEPPGAFLDKNGGIG